MIAVESFGADGNLSSQKHPACSQPCTGVNFSPALHCADPRVLMALRSGRGGREEQLHGSGNIWALGEFCVWNWGTEGRSGAAGVLELLSQVCPCSWGQDRCEEEQRGGNAHSQWAAPGKARAEQTHTHPQRGETWALGLWNLPEELTDGIPAWSTKISPALALLVSKFLLRLEQFLICFTEISCRFTKILYSCVSSLSSS